MKQLTNRDFEIIKTIANLKYLTLNQLRRLFFPSLPATRNRINILLAHHYLKMETVAGIDIYRLDKTGFQLYPGLVKKPNALFINHLLSINDFYIELKSICDNSMIKLAKFIPEYEINFDGFTHWADAGINLFSRIFNESIFFFLEIDKSTESWDKLNNMFYFYYNLYLKLTFRLLIICDSTRRLNNIRATLSKQFETKFLHFGWIKTAETALNRWKSFDITDQNHYDIQRNIITRSAHPIRVD